MDSPAKRIRANQTPIRTCPFAYPPTQEEPLESTEHVQMRPWDQLNVTTMRVLSSVPATSGSSDRFRARKHTALALQVALEALCSMGKG